MGFYGPVEKLSRSDKFRRTISRGRKLKQFSDILFVGAMVIALPVVAHAQSSSVSISGGTVAGNTPLEIRDGEYPLDAMLQNEQGDVKLSFTVDPMGHPANIRLLSSSGSQTLDLQSIRLSNSKWTYESVQPGAAVEVTFSWQLPVERVGDYDIKIAAPARNAPPPAPIQSHAVVVDDYPPLSIRTGETGIVGIRYVVKTDGSVGLVEIAQSSGIKRLDDAAANMVKTRWRFQPLGAETEMSATVSFHVIPPRNLLRCAASPVFADEEVFIAGTLV